MTSYRTQNPATGEVLEEFPELDDAGVTEAVKRADEAFRGWRDTPASERAATLVRISEVYAQRERELAEAITREMGKPVAQAVGEVQLAAAIYRWYGENGPDLLTEQSLEGVSSSRSPKKSVVRREPVGALLGIMPWNYPHYQVARFAAPNLMLGNTILLKHAPICAKSALLMEEVLHEAGVPEGAYTNVFISNDQVADVIADPRIHGISLTGSERAGAAVAEIAGRNLKKCVLELGGSDAMIILDSDDVAKTAKQVSAARLSNCGQACNSPKRILVHDDLYDDLVDQLTSIFEGSTTGDPADESTQVGPMSSGEALQGLLEQIDDARSKGANVRAGGAAVEGDGYFLQPTLITDITPEMRAYTEELFGPVAMLYRFSDVDDAVDFANSSPFGLSGSVWTRDVARGEEIADRLEVGMAYVNEHGTTLPGLPFGGVKRSGFGRELAAYGMDEFANMKLVRAPAGQ